MTSCPKCQATGKEFVMIWDCQELGDAKFRGWYCVRCQHHEKPIGREHKFKFKGKQIDYDK